MPPPPLFLHRGDDEHPQLPRWAANVGAPLALDLAPPAPDGVRGVDVLSWNLAIGTARLGEVVERLRGGEWGGAGRDPRRPLVILAQEAYRADASVPDRAPGRHHGGVKASGGQRGIGEVAAEAGLSLRYAPSMRNGDHRSDRGNAVLATAALHGAHAFALPLVRQRRVAVAAQLVGVPGLVFVSAHLDTWGRSPADRGPWWAFGSGRAAQSAALARLVVAREGAAADVVLGADLNSPLGRRDPALRALEREGFAQARPVGRWRSTFAGPVRLLLDHVLWHPGGGRVRGVTVERIDAPREAGGRVLGSDHHPLLARVELADG